MPPTCSIGWTDTKGVPTTPQIWFRRADPMDTADADKIVAFMRELHRNAYGTDEHLDPDALLRDVERAQRMSPRSVTFGCLESGEEVALIYLKTFYDDEPDVGLVGGFCIDKAYRGCGLLGKTYLCAHAAEKNARAQGFYHKFAFEQRGTYQDENGLHYRQFKKIGID